MNPNHVVVLMMENRSFDHMLGFLEQPGLTPLDEHVQKNPRADGQDVFVHRLNGVYDVSVDPGHGYQDVMSQLTGGIFHLGDPYKQVGGGFVPMHNDGFVKDYDRRLPKGAPPGQSTEIMGCWDPGAVPVISALAREFAVCANWRCSVPSETWPNRMFAHAGHSDGLLNNVKKLYDIPTIFGLLTHHDVSWRIYFDDVAHAATFVDTHRLFRHTFSHFGGFLQDAHNNELAHYSFIEPRHLIDGNSQHPRQPIWRGEQLIREVYDAVSKGPAWADTVLLVTYDEHGGFYDRATPVGAVPPEPGRQFAHGFDFDMLGPRVPAIVVSPRIPAGTVDTVVRDHTCIPRTVRNALGLREIEAPLGDREQQASDILGLLTLDQPRAAGDIHIPEATTPDDHAVRAAVEGAPELDFKADQDRGDVVLFDFQRDLLALAEAFEAAPPPEDPDDAAPSESASRAVDEIPPPNSVQDVTTLADRIQRFGALAARPPDASG